MEEQSVYSWVLVWFLIVTMLLAAAFSLVRYIAFHQKRLKEEEERRALVANACAMVTDCQINWAISKNLASLLHRVPEIGEPCFARFSVEGIRRFLYKASAADSDPQGQLFSSLQLLLYFLTAANNRLATYDLGHFSEVLQDDLPFILQHSQKVLTELLGFIQKQRLGLIHFSGVPHLIELIATLNQEARRGRPEN